MYGILGGRTGGTFATDTNQWNSSAKVLVIGWYFRSHSRSCFRRKLSSVTVSVLCLHHLWTFGNFYMRCSFSSSCAINLKFIFRLQCHIFIFCHT